MIDSIQFQNFKVLKSTKLPLRPFTLLVGPNGSGKSTALEGFEALREPQRFDFRGMASADVRSDAEATVAITLESSTPFSASLQMLWKLNKGAQQIVSGNSHVMLAARDRFRNYAFEPGKLAAPVTLLPTIELLPDGLNFPGFLDRLRDEAPERFEALNQDVARLLPEFDRILFDTPGSGIRCFSLRSRKGQHAIPASKLSHGTLLVLALLALSHSPTPPLLIGLEDPDRGIHPRLLRDIRDVIYRLCYPANYHDSREPVQVVATTQSPYFLDLFKDHPEEIVIAEKEGLEAHFKKLADRPDIQEILAEAPLGEVWYSGVLGGVPAYR
jgi:predicted ATPase